MTFSPRLKDDLPSAKASEVVIPEHIERFLELLSDAQFRFQGFYDDLESMNAYIGQWLENPKRGGNQHAYWYKGRARLIDGQGIEPEEDVEIRVVFPK